jgi:uncharacterized protein YecE (DUF72 family)
MSSPRPGRIFAGTSGYSYKEWKGSFFPEDLPQAEFLGFYARAFSTVEINNTFYRFPTEKVLEQWTAETPEGFTFAIKANQRITHTSRLRDVGEVTLSFVERCRSIGGRLGPILFQLPPQLRRDDDRLAAFLALLPPGGRYAIEFRHASWFEDAVLDALAGAGVALVQADDEKLASPRVATADFCYVRLRRDDYDETALDDWRAWIDGRRAEGRDVFVYLKHEGGGSSPEPIIRRLEGARRERGD